MKDNICVIFNIGVNQRKVWYIITFLNWLLKKVSQINENLKKFFHVTKSIENWYKLQIKANPILKLKNMPFWYIISLLQNEKQFLFFMKQYIIFWYIVEF